MGVSAQKKRGLGADICLNPDRFHTIPANVKQYDGHFAFTSRARAYKDSPGHPSSSNGINVKLLKGSHRFILPVAQTFKQRSCSFDILAINRRQMSIKSSKMSDMFQPFHWIRWSRLVPQLEGACTLPTQGLDRAKEKYSVQDQFNRLPFLSIKS